MASSSAKPTVTRVGRNVTLGIVISLGLVYVIWGSTYLGIRFADETLPPLLMAAVRFLIAGAILYLWSRAVGAPNPTRRQWLSGTVVGICLLAGGNGVVTLVEQKVPSGVTALLLGLVPLWTVLLMWLRRNGTRPTLRALMGVALGLVGVGALALHGGGAGGSGINPIALLLLFSSGIWAWGSLYAQRAELPSSPLMATAVEMLMGGAALLIMAAVSGEPATLTQHTISLKSLEALGYLIVFGSIVGYTAYTWALKHASASLVSTYAYVNPVVAVLLGWRLDNEPVTIWTLISAAIIVTSVVLITLPKRRKESSVAAAAALRSSSPEITTDQSLAALERR